MKKIQKVYKILFASPIILFIITTYVSVNIYANENEKKEVTIEPFQFYEECMPISADEVLYYSFEASKPVDFNIHFHTEKDIHYPVAEKNIQKHKGMCRTIHPKGKEYYCLMWKNLRAEHVKLSFRCEVKDE